MSTFALLEVPQVKGQIRLQKLAINGVCEFDEFCSRIESEGNLRAQLRGIFAVMEDVAHQRRLPKGKFRDITPKGERNKEYEIKKGALRVYLTKDENGHIVVIGGKKNAQPRDLGRFRVIKKRYFDSKQRS